MLETNQDDTLDLFLNPEPLSHSLADGNEHDQDYKHEHTKRTQLRKRAVGPEIKDDHSSGAISRPGQHQGNRQFSISVNHYPKPSSHETRAKQRKVNAIEIFPPGPSRNGGGFFQLGMNLHHRC